MIGHFAPKKHSATHHLFRGYPIGLEWEKSNTRDNLFIVDFKQAFLTTYHKGGSETTTS